MIEALFDLTDLARAQILSAFLVFLRVGAAMALLPAFGERMVPLRVRLVLTLAFTAIVTPAVSLNAAQLQASGFALGTEVVIGLALGAVLRLFILALQIAGSIAAQSVSLAQIFGTQAVDAMPAIGHVITLSGLTIAVIAGLHLKIAEFFILSYDLMPAGRFPAPQDLTDWGVERTARAFGLGFTLAAPFVITSVIYNLALGAINRAMPQLMVAFVGAPAITAGGLILLALALPFMLQVWLSTMDSFFENPSGATR